MNTSLPTKGTVRCHTPQREITEGRRSPAGVSVVVEALARSQGLKSAGTIMAPVSQGSLNREMKAKSNNLGQHEPAPVHFHICRTTDSSEEPVASKKRMRFL